MAFYDEALATQLGDDGETCLIPGTIIPDEECLKRLAKKLPKPPVVDIRPSFGVPWWAWVGLVWLIARRR
jgi:hypothetical protein